MVGHGLSQLIFREDGRGREAVLGAVIEKIFFPRYLHLGPAVGSYADNSSGANGFDDKIGFELHLYAAATEGNFATRLLYSKEFTT